MTDRSAADKQTTAPSASDHQLKKQDRAAHEVQRRWPLISGLVAVALVVLGGTLIAIRQFQIVPYAIDSEWMDELYEHRTPFFVAVADAFDFMGGGIVGVFVVPIAFIVLLLLLKRRWGALYFVAAVVLSAGLVQVIKNLVDRPRPEQILVTADFGSFPSGHTANAATLAVVLGIVFWRWWVWAAGLIWTVAMLVSRNYLGAHWLTDTLGGLVLGAAVALIVLAPFAQLLTRESLRRRGVAPSPAVPGPGVKPGVPQPSPVDG